MLSYKKFLNAGLSLLFLFTFGNCDNSTETKTLFEASDRYSNDFNLPSNINKIVITNSIGFTFLLGNTDTSKIRYVLDRKVQAKTKSLAESELKKIDLEQYISTDTLYCNIIFPADLNNIYQGILSIDIPYKKSVAFRNPNKGVYSSDLYADLEIETDSYEITVERHNSSFEAHSTEGNITSTLILPQNGFCLCYSDSGDIYVKIPITTSSNVTLKTNTGTITYSNLNLAVSSSSDHEITGTLSTGDGQIYLESKSGDIILEGF